LNNLCQILFSQFRKYLILFWGAIPTKAFWEALIELYVSNWFFNTRSQLRLKAERVVYHNLLIGESSLKIFTLKGIKLIFYRSCENKIIVKGNY